ncbi:MAG TPA: dihydrofolate reductase family protein [Allosphingosinicella sp.]|nr:dihydrofolate reductase family protein [Allosphingosinicella sp.]
MARKIIGGAFLSMDGVMQAPGGPEEDPSGGFAHGGWLATLFDEGLGNQIDTLFSQPFDLLLGRRTYDIFAAHWPFQPAEDPIAALFARIGKYVVTGTDMPLAWEGSRRLAGIEAVAALREEDGPNLVIQGSSTLYPQLLRHGLLDRLVTMTAPLVLGQGKRLFGDGTPPGSFTLVEHRVSSGGIAMATYDVKGGVETGSFAMAEPSIEELARRERLQRDG